MKSISFDCLKTNLKQLTQKVESNISIKKIINQLDSKSELNHDFKELKIGTHIAKTPIVQGGMGVGISLSSLASAVANEGGVGVIAANGIGLLDKDYFKDGDNASVRAFRKEIRIARERQKESLV